MSESNARKRNLPSWMSSREEEKDDNEKSKQSKNHGKSKNDQNASDLENKGEEKSGSSSSSGASSFSKLMEGVVFVLSGFVNPDRGILRSQMLEMGAVYEPDWNSNCTLLVCAFSNTPKFRQVKADGGTIISKDWISECYSQKKLVDIETYLLHAGKPWRKQSISHETREDVKPSTSSRSSKHEDKGLSSNKTTGSLDVKSSTSSKPLKQEEKGWSSKKTTGPSKVKSLFSPLKVKKWAVEDLKRTLSWLESQDEKPEPGEIKKIAAEGILTCLQDAIDSLKKGQGIQEIGEQWACVPRVVEELAKSDGKSADLYREAMVCKQIYELEFLNMDQDEFVSTKKPQNHKKDGKKKENVTQNDDPCYDSDATIEMTEEEIDRSYNSIASSL